MIKNTVGQYLAVVNQHQPRTEIEFTSGAKTTVYVIGMLLKTFPVHAVIVSWLAGDDGIVTGVVLDVGGVVKKSYLNVKTEKPFLVPDRIIN